MGFLFSDQLELHDTLIAVTVVTRDVEKLTGDSGARKLSATLAVHQAHVFATTAAIISVFAEMTTLGARLAFWCAPSGPSGLSRLRVLDATIKLRSQW
jgi:hypothetical protein